MRVRRYRPSKPELITELFHRLAVISKSEPRAAPAEVADAHQVDDLLGRKGLGHRGDAFGHRGAVETPPWSTIELFDTFTPTGSFGISSASLCFSPMASGPTMTSTTATSVPVPVDDRQIGRADLLAHGRTRS